MIIPMPAEYLDQLYTEIGLLFLISLFLLILFLCTVIRFHTKKKAFSEHDSQIRKLNEQLQTLASERDQLRSEANDYQNQIRQMDLKIQEYEDQFKLQDIQRQEYIDRHSIISSDVYNSPSKYYYFTKSCMNANESLMYYYINYILRKYSLLLSSQIITFSLRSAFIHLLKCIPPWSRTNQSMLHETTGRKALILLSATVTKQTDNICTPLFYLWNWMVLLIFHQQNTEPKPLDASRKMTDSKIHFLVTWTFPLFVFRFLTII